MIRRSWCVWGLLLAVGCAPGNPGLIIGGVLAPSEDCTFDPGDGDVLTAGFLDVSAGTAYEADLLLFNQLLELAQSGGEGPPMADPNVITVREVEIELRQTDGTTLAVDGPNPYTVPASGLVVSSDGEEAGVGAAATQIIPPAYTASLPATGRVIAVIRAIGTTGGDAEVVSNEYHFAIDLCDGCLFQCRFDEEGEPVCAPACRAGQDQIHVHPFFCGDEFALRACASGS